MTVSRLYSPVFESRHEKRFPLENVHIVSGINAATY
jgi:hypothetical protein